MDAGTSAQASHAWQVDGIVPDMARIHERRAGLVLMINREARGPFRIEFG